MNPHTGELAELSRDEERPGFERLPGRLQAMAREKMRRFEQMARTVSFVAEAPKVNLMSRSPLSLWAKKKRKAKLAAASRRRNRR